MNARDILHVPERSTMKRTKSSLLAFKLREFLDAKDSVQSYDLPLPRLHEMSSPPKRAPQRTRAPAALQSQDTVWVDCFYYGFYMDKARLPAFQASLRQHHNRAPQPTAG